MFCPGTADLRIPFAHCIEKAVKERYPEEDESKYVGFKKSSRDIPKEEFLD